MMIGQLVYYPQNDLTDQIVKEMNQTFEAIEMLSDMDVKGLFQDIRETISCPGSEICSVLDFLERFLTPFIETLKCFNVDKIKGFKSGETEELIEHLDDLMCNFQAEDTLRTDNPINCTTRLWSVIYFNYEDENGELQNITDTMSLDDLSHLTYTLRLPRDLSQSTLSIQPYFWSAGARKGSGSMKHFIGGFIYLQNMIDSAFARLQARQNGRTNYNTEGVWMQMFPYPCYTPDSFLDAISGLLPMLLCLSWVFSVSVTVRNVVAEKESRKKEMM